MRPSCRKKADRLARKPRTIRGFSVGPRNKHQTRTGPSSAIPRATSRLFNPGSRACGMATPASRSSRRLLRVPRSPALACARFGTDSFATSQPENLVPRKPAARRTTRSSVMKSPDGAHSRACLSGRQVRRGRRIARPAFPYVRFLRLLRVLSNAPPISPQTSPTGEVVPDPITSSHPSADAGVRRPPGSLSKGRYSPVAPGQGITASACHLRFVQHPVCHRLFIFIPAE